MNASSPDCRLILDGEGAGPWNMSVDEALLESAIASGMPALRIYRWSEPTLSLGYFQTYTDRKLHPESLDCQLVRRRSGGGAILHDDELTYAIVVPIDDRWGRDAEALYTTVHSAVVTWLQTYDRSTHLFDGAATDAPFLCFHRRSNGDLIHGEDKILGSAQRRSKSALLQHGSLLLRRSRYATSLPGLFDDAAAAREIGVLQHEFAMAILGALEFEAQPTELSDVDFRRAEELNHQRFSTTDWSQRR